MRPNNVAHFFGSTPMTTMCSQFLLSFGNALHMCNCKLPSSANALVFEHSRTSDPQHGKLMHEKKEGSLTFTSHGIKFWSTAGSTQKKSAKDDHNQGCLFCRETCSMDHLTCWTSYNFAPACQASAAMRVQAESSHFLILRARKTKTWWPSQLTISGLIRWHQWLHCFAYATSHA